MKCITPALFFLFLISALHGIGQNNSRLVYTLDSIPISTSAVIKARLASCGEFGSHIEQIIISRDTLGYTAKLKKEHPCLLARQAISPDAKEISLVRLDSADRESINRYFMSFKNFKAGTVEWNAWNANNEFSIQTHSGKNYSFEDWQFKWDDFNPLKNRLFGTSSKSYVR